MLVLAGPGSGKTAVLTARIINLINVHGIAPERILVLTFSKEAANEMQERFSSRIGDIDHPVRFGTFHAVFYHILKKQGLYNENSILDTKTKREYVRQAGKRLNIAECHESAWQELMLARISAKKSGREPEASDDREAEIFEGIFNAYSEKCRRERKLDFDDMITECIKLLKEIPKVLSKWQDKYDHILVDEFQDIDLKQYEVLKLLAGDRANIFAVGDDDQSIYGFRGACPGIMKRFKDDHPNIKTVNLITNYRSKRDIIENATAVIRHNTDRLLKTQMPISSEAGFVELSVFKTPFEEASYVIDKIRELKRNAPDISTGILYRTGNAVQILENEFKKQRTPYYRSEKSGNFYDNEWVKDILSYLRLGCGRGGKKDLLSILNKPDRGLSREAFLLRTGQENGTDPDFGKGITEPAYGTSGGLSFEDCITALLWYYEDDAEKLTVIKRLKTEIRFLKDLPLKGAVNFILRGIGYEKELLKRSGGQEASVSGLVSELYDNMEGHVYTEEFLSHADRVNETFPENEKKNRSARIDPRGQIILQTVHASKGLEYDAVFIIGMQEGIFPHKKAKTKADIEEERRLFYVAMTRARERLYICARKKDSFGKKESRFIHELLIDQKPLFDIK